MRYGFLRALLLANLVLLATTSVFCQTTIDLQDYFTQKLSLTADQVTAVRNGQPVAKSLDARSPAEIFVVGVIYINADPESYLKYAYDFNRLRSTPGYLAINKLSNPPQQSDLVGFSFSSDDVKSLKNCKPGDCDVQLPGATIEAFRAAITWSASNVNDQVNQYAQKIVLQRLPVYMKEGNRTLGAVYNDKNQQVNVADQFNFVLSNQALLPLPDFYSFLQNYPDSKPATADDFFYWDNVKFGLKPTLRIIQVSTMRGTKPSEPALVIAEKQLYSSHYFETALDISYCVRGSDNPEQLGFFLIQVMGSEQAGLTGFKGSMIRRVAVSHSVSDLEKSLSAIKGVLERH
jgi:hypothetical protein